MKKLIIGFLFVFILLNVVSSLSAEIIISDKYKDIVAGEELNFVVEIKYPENSERKDLRLTYVVFDEDGKNVAEKKVLKAIETQASFIGEIRISENIRQGKYRLEVTIWDYEDLNQKIYETFYVIGAESSESVIKYLICGFLALLFIGVLLLVDIFVHRKKLYR